MYYFLTAHDGKPEGAGSVKLLLWEGIKLAHRFGMIFDFHGLPRPGAVNILTGFGGIVANRIVVTKIPAHAVSRPRNRLPLTLRALEPSGPDQAI